MTRSEMPRLYPLTRSFEHMTALQACAASWQQGPERFWDFDAVLVMLGRPVCRGYFAATSETSPWLGVLLVDVGPFTADLLYLYVFPPNRGQGIAREMMEDLLEVLRKTAGIEALLLEVRPSNAAALRLYRGLRFDEVGRRKGYYSDGEDALVLRFDLVEAP